MSDSPVGSGRSQTLVAIGATQAVQRDRMSSRNTERCGYSRRTIAGTDSQRPGLLCRPIATNNGTFLTTWLVLHLGHRMW